MAVLPSRPDAPATAINESRSISAPYRWRRNLLSLAVAAMGMVDLLSALLSRPPERLMALLHVVPTAVLETSRTYTLLAGALLLVTAWGLRRGKRRAFVAALFLCAISVPVNLLKAFDFEEATVAAGLMFVLGISADAFRVRSRGLSLAAWRSRAMWFALALAVYSIVGCWLLESQHSHAASVQRAVAEAAYQLFGIGEHVLAVPRRHRVVTWFLNSISVLGVTGLIGLALAALRPATHRNRHRAEAGHVAALLRQFGDSSVSAFALADDCDYFFSRNRRAVIAYRFESDTLLAIGDPIGPSEDIESLLRDFQLFCRERDWQFAFFQARPEHLSAYQALGWRVLHIGEDPVLWTDRFTLAGGAVGDVRRGANNAAKSGVEIRHFHPDREPFDPARDPDGLLEQMQSISQSWLRAHQGSERGFCMGRFEPQRLRSEWLAVAWDPQRRRVEGFVTWVPIWARRGWAMDLMRRRPDSITGTMELLVVRSVEQARERGGAMLSLSLSALASVEEPGGDRSAASASEESAAASARLAREAAQANRAREFLSDHLARFYDFRGLFRWKKKFNPEFEDRFLVYPDRFALPQVALALVRAQSPGGGLLSYLRNRAPLPPAARAEATATTAGLAAAPGSVLRLTMPAPTLGDPSRTVRVCLPPSYDRPEAAGRRYPTVYLLHGWPGSQDKWFDSGHVAEVAAALRTSGEIPELILVCPNGNGRGLLNRTLYMNSQDGRVRMEDYIAHDLVAWTDATFRTCPAAASRAVIGISDGATAALNMVFHHADVFGACGGHSGQYLLRKAFAAAPMLGPEPGASRLLASYSPALQAASVAPRLAGITIYFDCGTGDGDIGDNRDFHRTLESLGVRHTYREFPGSHSWDYWRMHLFDSLRAVAAGIK